MSLIAEVTPRFECLACGEVFDDKHACGVGGLAPAECPCCGEETRVRDRMDRRAP